MEVLLPKAQSQAQTPTAITLTVGADGQMAVNVIRADANATHQAVVTAMQAANRAGIQKLSFAAQVAD